MSDKFPHLLKELKYKAREYAHAYGLNIEDVEVVFEVIDFEEMNFVSARGGFPVRYSHWLWEMKQDRLSQGYRYGLHKIYEMVLNSGSAQKSSLHTSPYYAYLLDTNSVADQKTVMAHVYGHVDFFRSNLFFTPINSQHIVDTIANHASRIQQFADKHGEETVSDFILTCLSLENLIDIHSLGIKRHEKKKKTIVSAQDEENEEQKEEPARFFQDPERHKEYMNQYVNPPEKIAKEQEEIKKKKRRKKEIETGKKIPAEPERDIVQFLIEYAPLENWQREVLAILREEAYYFVPQAQTKIMNEGWAAYWHSKIGTGSDRIDAYRKDKALPPFLTPSEIVDYADHHSGTLAMGRNLNPYKIGIELFRHIEERWNKGKFGKEWEECVRCGSYADQQSWDKKLGLGREKIFEVRKHYCDVTFLDEFFTEEFCKEYNLFTYEYDEDDNLYRIASRDFSDIKEAMLSSFANLGEPFIYAIDGNFHNRKELLFFHRHFGFDLKYDYAVDVLKATYKIWGRPVHIRTKIKDEEKLLSFNGSQFNETPIK